MDWILEHGIVRESLCALQARTNALLAGIMLMLMHDAGHESCTSISA